MTYKCFSIHNVNASHSKHGKNRYIYQRFTDCGRGAIAVQHLHGVQGVEGSNPFTPTIKYQRNQWVTVYCCNPFFVGIVKVMDLARQKNSHASN